MINQSISIGVKALLLLSPCKGLVKSALIPSAILVPHRSSRQVFGLPNLQEYPGAGVSPGWKYLQLQPLWRPHMEVCLVDWCTRPQAQWVPDTHVHP